ncbi:ABC transporter substrate-binding protein [Treponema parvum]|uniref:ABC transporter substrate-binding protein n=1 Tax=Treponema parvum TaxID=138851 RepID=UPI001AEC339C|nr:ABC transporter substrate-binding protein [Treponema parvum]QTQ16817.1 ABC transporter substrate-binding protein [Treponema parvum]
MKKILLSIIAATFVFTALGCTKKSGAASEPATRTIVDQNGDTITIPSKIERVVITSLWPLPSIYCLYRGGITNLVGMHPGSMAAAKNSYLAAVYPDVLNISTKFVENNVVNIEQLMSLKPDVILFSATNTKEKEMFRAAGLPAIGFATNIAGWNTIETYASWIQLLGEIFGDTGRSTKIIEYGRKIEEMVKSRNDSVSDADRPKTLILFRYDQSGIATSGSTHFGQYWITTAGGKNVAQDIKGVPSINMEQIYQWNPDIIVLTNFTAYLPEDLYDNKIKGYDWSTVNAVKNHKVYKFPLGMYRWYPPSSDSPLSLLWLSTKLQSERFADIDMDKTIKDYFKNLYGVTLTDEDVNTIYNPPREAAVY